MTKKSITIGLLITLKKRLFIALAVSTLFVTAVANTIDRENKPMNERTTTITILQSADIHGQLDTHQELFVENGKVVFRERGGMAVIKTIFDEERAANPGPFTFSTLPGTNYQFR